MKFLISSYVTDMAFRSDRNEFVTFIVRPIAELSPPKLVWDGRFPFDVPPEGRWLAEPGISSCFLGGAPNGSTSDDSSEDRTIVVSPFEIAPFGIPGVSGA